MHVCDLLIYIYSIIQWSFRFPDVYKVTSAHRVIIPILVHVYIYVIVDEYSAISSDWSECLLYGAVWWMFNQALHSGANGTSNVLTFQKIIKYIYFFFIKPAASVGVYISRSRELILLDGWIVKWAFDIVPTDIKPIGNVARISETHLKSRYY